MPMQAGVVGHWRFENSASVGSDSGPNGFNLGFSSSGVTPTYLPLGETGAGSAFFHPLPGTSTPNQGAAYFDGNDLGTVPDNAAFTSTTFSIEAYINVDATPSGSQVIVGHFRSDISRRSWALLVRNGKLALYLSPNGSTSEEILSAASITAGEDYYVAATVDLANLDSGGVTLYLQNLTQGGALVQEHFPHTTTALYDSDAPLSIGATANGSSDFAGLIDEVRLSNTKLPVSEMLTTAPEPEDPPPTPSGVGFVGIWYFIGTHPTYGYKYSGGMATYPHQHSPIAIYAPAVNKTFFVYGGTNAANSTLLHMISYYDHARKQVARPRQLVNKGTTDAHDNPCLAIDDAGYLWVFSNTHGNSRRSYLWKSNAPYDISAFTEVALPAAVFPDNRFNYGNPWYIPGQGFFFLHTRYNGGDRDLYYTNSADGVNWTPRQLFAQMLGGQYEVTSRFGSKVGTAFDVHPGNADTRTNLYYLETPDLGATWRTAGGTAVTPPLTNAANPALIRNYQAEGKLVYIKDLRWDSAGRPIILYLTSTTYQPGPLATPRMLHIARWTGTEWLIRDVFTTDHNYDHGSLYIEADDRWRIIAPFLDGPQPYGTGGEMAIWTSTDQGLTWQMERQLTSGSPYNHSYARRPVDARDEFYALWADGNSMGLSPSRLYFTSKHGDAVFRLPATMSGDFASPEVAYIADPQSDPDGDGVATIDEFTHGTDPRDAASALRIFANNAQFTFPTVPGRLYNGWYSEALAGWTPLFTGYAGTGEDALINDPGAAGQPQRYYKVEAQ